MVNLIGFAGRMRSGKGELSAICERYGYQRLTFAYPLKSLCAELLGITLEEEDKLKNANTKINFTFNDDSIKKLSESTSIPYDIIASSYKGMTLHSVRKMLQVIGTDIIRKHNTDWHVEQIEKMIEDGKKYVFDDIRFPNEKSMVERHGGDTWFIVRPTLANVSNHISETSLSWKDFDHQVIINNKSLEALKFKWETFLNDYDNNKAKRKELLEPLIESKSDCVIEDFSIYDMLLIDKDLYTYSPFDKGVLENMKIVYETIDGQACIEYSTNKHFITVSNALNIEDLKRYITK